MIQLSELDCFWEPFYGDVENRYEAGREVLEEKKRYELLQQEAANTAQELTDLRDLVFHQQENMYLDN